MIGNNSYLKDVLWMQQKDTFRNIWMLSYYTCKLHLKVKVSDSGCPVTANSKSSEKVPKNWLWKVTSTIWQAPEGTTPSSGLKEKQRPKLVSGHDSLKVASISPLLDSCTWTKKRIHWFSTQVSFLGYESKHILSGNMRLLHACFVTLATGSALKDNEQCKYCSWTLILFCRKHFPILFQYKEKLFYAKVWTS